MTSTAGSSTSFIRTVLQTVNAHTSTAGMGFAGATGLFASGLTDLASALGPRLPWFVLIVVLGLIVLSIIIRNASIRMREGNDAPSRLGMYCNIFLVALGSLFGSGILLATGLFVEQSDDSRILSLLNEIKSGVTRVESKVDTVSEGVEGIGQRMSLRDITGRSGTGMIGDDAIFRVSLANERLMEEATCSLRLDAAWQERVSLVDDSCERFTVKLPDRALLDDNNNTLGDVVQVPFVITMHDRRGKMIAEYSGTYPFHNNYRNIRLVLDPPGNRLGINERRRAHIEVENAVIPDGVECHWGNSTHPPINFQPTSSNRCEGWLSTEVEDGSYAHRKLAEEGEQRGAVYIQLQSAGDFSMLGIKEAKFAVTR